MTEPSPFPEQASDLPEPSPDFQDQVFNRIRTYERKRTWIRNGFTGVLAAGCAFWLGQQGVNRTRGFSPVQTPRVISADQGVQWLLDTQQDDGSWNITATGGHMRFTTGVTGLATLALLQSPEPVPSENLRSALEYLEEQASLSAMFDQEGPEFYNSMLALVTLQEANRHLPDLHRGQLVLETLSHLIRIQHPEGGWGYPSSSYGYRELSVPNSAVTWWVVRALQRSPDLPGRKEALAKASTWLSERFLFPEHPQYREDDAPAPPPSSALFWMAQAFLHREVPGEIPQRTQDAYADFLRSQVEQPEELLKAMRKNQNADGSWDFRED